MKNDLIFSNLTELKTPVGTITVECLDSHIPFDVVSGIFSSDYPIYAADNKTILEHIFADANYQIRIATSNLKVGANCIIRFNEGTFQYNSGDEHTISLTGTFDIGKLCIHVTAKMPANYLVCRQIHDRGQKRPSV